MVIHHVHRLEEARKAMKRDDFVKSGNHFGFMLQGREGLRSLWMKGG